MTPGSPSESSIVTGTPDVTRTSTPAAARTDGYGSVHLAIPAVARFLRIARLTAAGLGADLGFNIEEIEDLRVAIDELAAAVIDGAPADAVLQLEFRETDGGLEITGACSARTANPPKLHPVAQELLAIVVDDFTIDAADRSRNFRMQKAPRS